MAKNVAFDSHVLVTNNLKPQKCKLQRQKYINKAQYIKRNFKSILQ